MASSFNDSNFQLGGHVAGYLGDSNASLVLHCPDRLPNRTGRHDPKDLVFRKLRMSNQNAKIKGRKKKTERERALLLSKRWKKGRQWDDSRGNPEQIWLKYKWVFGFRSNGFAPVISPPVVSRFAARFELSFVIIIEREDSDTGKETRGKGNKIKNYGK